MVEGDPDPTVGLEMEPLTLNNLIDDTCPEFLAETTSGNEEITDPVASTSKNDDIPPSNAKETGDENAGIVPIFKIRHTGKQPSDVPVLINIL